MTMVPKNSRDGSALKSQKSHQTLCAQCATLELKGHISSREIRFLYRAGASTTLSFPRHTSISSACPFCRLMAYSLGGDSLVTELTYEVLGDTRTLESKSTQSFCARPWNGTQRGNRIAPLGRDAFRISSQASSYPRRLVRPDIADRDLMKSWISRSLGSETPPGSLRGICAEPRLNKCLIDVKDMCIVDVGDIIVPYFALSYVWGNVSSLQLLKDNRALLLAPGCLTQMSASLAPVIHDAMQITRELAYRFLWVDSLCIMQDDAENKHSQISSMNHIYLEADVTLVAAYTVDAKQGLPGVRPYSTPRTQHIERVLYMEMAIILPDISEIESVYISRAWTYQEERLSRRLLYFTESQVYFSDLRSTFSEDRHEDHPDWHLMRGGVLLGQLYPLSELAWWAQSVQEYSARSLSFSDDRYNAYRGIEMELKERWSYPCLRGLPVENFIHGLCWNPDVPTGKTSAVRIETLPSWSWCGWTGVVVCLTKHVLPAVMSIEAVDGHTVWKWKRKDAGEQSLGYKRTTVDLEADNPRSSAAIIGPGDRRTSMIHQSLSANLVLRFQSLSALVQVELSRVEGYIPSYRIPTFDNNSCGSVDIYNLSTPFPTRMYVECILIGKFDERSSLPHIHFTTAPEDCAPNLRKRNIELHPDHGILQDWAFLVVRYKEEGSIQSSVCERMGTLTMHAHCFLARYPISREVNLG